MTEAWRARRTAYSSGRRETFGYTKKEITPFARKVRKRRSELFKPDASLKFTPYQSNFRWRVH